MKLKEGLRKGDLDGLVLPLISVDEYDSKIGNEAAIVVGFYVFEQDAAHDLSNFIERAPYQVLDTDVSPAPTKDGYYLCFAEINRSEDFPNVLVTLLSEVTKLCNVGTWQFTTLKLPKDQILTLSLANLQKHVNLDPQKSESNSNQNVMAFFKESALNNVTLHSSQLMLCRQTTQMLYEFVDLTTEEPQGALMLDESAAAECVLLEKMLGGPYSVHKIAGTTVIENFSQGTFLLLNKR